MGNSPKTAKMRKNGPMKKIGVPVAHDLVRQSPSPHVQSFLGFPRCLCKSSRRDGFHAGTIQGRMTYRAASF